MESIMQLAAELSATPDGRAKVEQALREALAVVCGQPCDVRCTTVARHAERLQTLGDQLGVAISSAETVGEQLKLLMAALGRAEFEAEKIAAE